MLEPLARVLRCHPMSKEQATSPRHPAPQFDNVNYLYEFTSRWFIAITEISPVAGVAARRHHLRVCAYVTLKQA